MSDIPSFSTAAAADLARRSYSLTPRFIHRLDSYADQNFRIQTLSGECYVLKVANADEDRAVLEGQNQALLQLAEHAPDLPVPRVCRTRNGAEIAETTGPDGKRHAVRMLTFLTGQTLAEIDSPLPTLLQDAGRVLGKLDHALQGFTHSGLRRKLRWDLMQALDARAYLPCLTEPTRRAFAEQCLSRFEEHLLPALGRLRRGVIHGDANDYNWLVDGPPDRPRITGLIDFGDMVESAVVCDPAIACAYLMLSRPDPIEAALAFLGGYVRRFPLLEPELVLFYDLVRTRLCVSVLTSAYEKTRQPENEYLSVTEGPAWQLLERMESWDAGQLRERFAALAEPTKLPVNPSSRS